MTKAIVDTNVAKVANGRKAAPQASARCVATCARRLQTLMSAGVLVIDDEWHIIREYGKELSREGQPGPGDAFFKWVLTIQANPNRCERVHVHPLQGGAPGVDFAEFPSIPELRTFDPSDRKFVAVALAHPEHPPIWNAVDSDWNASEEALSRQGIAIEFLCGNPPV